MKITKVEAIELSLPAEQIEHKATGTNDTLIIRIHTDEGIVGIGEVESSSRMARAVMEAPFSSINNSGLERILVGLDPLDIAVINEKLYQETFYVGRRGLVIHAIGGVDIALWDIAGKYYGKPIYQLLGGAFRKKIRVYASDLFGKNGEETYQKAKRWREAGFTAVKFGWPPIGESEKLDLELVAGARRGMGDDGDVMIDAGCCWDVKTAKRRCRQFEQFNLAWLEEPLAQDDLDGYRELAAVSNIPIAAGEGEAGVFAYKDLIMRGNIDVVQIDLAKNGFSAAQKVGDLADLCHKRVCNHFYSTPINLAAGLHWVAARKSANILEYCVEDSVIRRELINECLEPVDGYMTVPEKPGLGITLNEDIIEKYRVR